MQIPVQILHMNEGLGQNSYYNNSLLQKKVILRTKLMLEETIVELCQKSLPRYVTMVDMGCSSGPNTLLPLQEIIETIDSTCTKLNKKPPMLQYFLNDLPGNDFNTIFRSLLPNFHLKLDKEQCFIGAMPGNFYGRLFPSNSLHFVYSSSSLHWSSQVAAGLISENGIPLNKGNICLDESSPTIVQKAYLDQFDKDFTKFLRSRSEEMVCGGQMVLTFMGKSDQIPYCKYGGEIFQLVGNSLKDMVNEGMIEESKLEKFNIPFYSPSAEEVRKVIEREDSFSINKGIIEEFQTSWDANIEDGNNESTFNLKERGKFVSNYGRAAMEPMLAAHFGDSIIDNLFHRFSFKVVDCLEKGTGFFNHIAVSITKK